MSLRLNSDYRRKSKNRPIRDKGFDKVKQEHNDVLVHRNRKNIKEYETYPELSSTDTHHVNAKLASQAAMAVIFAKSENSLTSQDAKKKAQTRKPTRTTDIKTININNNARSKVEEIYKKQILSPDIIYRQKPKQSSIINQSQPPRLQDLAAKVTLYEDCNSYIPKLPNNDFTHRKTTKQLPQKRVPEKTHFNVDHQRTLPREEKEVDDSHRKAISPVMSALAANKALLEFKSYEKQQDLIKQDLLRKIDEQKEEFDASSQEEADENKGIYEGYMDDAATSLPSELKKAVSINKKTNDLVNKIITSHKFGVHDVEDDDLHTSDQISSENERDTLERLEDFDEPPSARQMEESSGNGPRLKAPRKERVPPPPISPSFISQQTQSSVSELTQMASKSSSNSVSMYNSEVVKFNAENLNNKVNKEKRSLSLAENSGDKNQVTKTRSHRSNTISTLFHNMIASSNNTSPSTNNSHEKISIKKGMSFSPNDTKEGSLSLESNQTNSGSKNLFKRTMRSLSLSKKSPEPSTDVSYNEATEKQESKTNDTLKKSPRIEYSVFHNNLLPSYYKNEEGAINNSSDTKGKVQFRTTLRDNLLNNTDNIKSNSRHRRLLEKLHVVHANENKPNDSNSSRNSSKLDSSNLKSRKKSYIDRKKGDNLFSRFSDSEYSDSDNDDYDSNIDLNSFGSSNHNILNRDNTNFGNDSTTKFSEVHDYDEDLQKYQKDKKRDSKIKHNISGGGRKSDIFIKIPAKLAYNTVKKKTDNWEFRKNHALKNVLKNDENVASAKIHNDNDDERDIVTLDVADSIITDTLNPSSTMIPSDSKAVDDVSSIKPHESILPKNALNESSYIIGVHTKSNNKKKFDENKPWKSHVDVGYITTEEKKRYEAIWVSNKNRYLEMLPWYGNKQEKNDLESDINCMSLVSSGLNMDKEIEDSVHANKDDCEEDLMVNFVAYEIYNRSNLPPKVLKKIYDLIDVRQDGALNKQSFIVGMWLIDQCLYGKKLPDKVPDLVWTSVDKMVIGVDISHKSLLRNKKKIARQEIKDLKKHEKVVKEINKKEQQIPKQAI